MHKRKEHEENMEVCKLFEKGNCTYHEICWVSHKNSKIDKRMPNGKKIKSGESKRRKLQNIVTGFVTLSAVYFTELEIYYHYYY